jgi:hypothetical protein
MWGALDFDVFSALGAFAFMPLHNGISFSGKILLM